MHVYHEIIASRMHNCIKVTTERTDIRDLYFWILGRVLEGARDLAKSITRAINLTLC